MKIKKIKSGTKVFDWKIPEEWNVKKAFLKDKYGVKNFVLSSGPKQEQTLITEEAWQDIKKNKLDALATSYEWVKTDFISLSFLSISEKNICAFFRALRKWSHSRPLPQF